MLLPKQENQVGTITQYQHLYIDDMEFFRWENERKQFSPRITVAYIRDYNNNVCYVGIALCSLDDNPEKSQGRSVSLKRAQNMQKCYVGTDGAQKTMCPINRDGVNNFLDSYSDYYDFSYIPDVVDDFWWSTIPMYKAFVIVGNANYVLATRCTEHEQKM